MADLNDKYSIKEYFDTENFEFYKDLERNDWLVTDFKNIAGDRDDYDKAPPRIKKAFRDILMFFAPGDLMISDNLYNFAREAKTREEQMFINRQILNETVHAETYTMFIHSLPKEDQKIIFDGVGISEIRKKANKILDLIEGGRDEFLEKLIQKIPKDCEGYRLIMDKINKKKTYALRKVAAACAEGIFFVALFQIIFFFNKLNIFKEFSAANLKINGDEIIHRNQNCMMAKRYLTKEELGESILIIKESVEIEKEHLRYILSEPLLSESQDRENGITIPNLDLFIEKLADQICIRIGTSPIYKSEIVLGWLSNIGDPTKNNFYERVSAATYTRGEEKNQDEKEITYDDLSEL